MTGIIHSKTSSNYGITITPNRIADSEYQGCIGRYLNHSHREYNVYCVLNTIDGEKNTGIFVSENIVGGTELLFNYGKNLVVATCFCHHCSQYRLKFKMQKMFNNKLIYNVDLANNIHFTLKIARREQSVLEEIALPVKKQLNAFIDIGNVCFNSIESYVINGKRNGLITGAVFENCVYFSEFYPFNVFDESIIQNVNDIVKEKQITHNGVVINCCVISLMFAHTMTNATLTQGEIKLATSFNIDYILISTFWRSEDAIIKYYCFKKYNSNLFRMNINYKCSSFDIRECVCNTL